MQATALALAGYIGYFLLLLLLLASVRVIATLGGKPANSFRPDGSDMPGFGQRLTRVHANAYESFPFVGGALILALATQNTAITDGLALWLLAARVLQGLTHLASSSVLAVQIRFAFFIAQFVIVANWALTFIGRFMH